ncbi:flagellar biosynthesis protein FliQ [bacterium]|nr:flagellar biosynthesis protein FliQ [bacterium]
MTPDTVVDIGREAMTIALMMALPMLFVALATGLVVGLFQAATQIQEQTLSFIPKLVAIAVSLVVTGPWLLQVMLDYWSDLIVNTVPRIIGV